MLPFRKDPLLALFRLSVVFAAIAFAHALLIGRTLSATFADIWELILLCPSLAGFFLLQGRAVAQAKAGASQSEDARRSARTVARVGARFTVGLSAVPVLIQAVWIAGIVGIPQTLALDPDWVLRAVFLLLGGLIAYFGNVVPRTPPIGGADPVVHRRAMRWVGWIMVIHGVFVCLGALALPADAFKIGWPAAIGSMLACSAIAIAAAHALKPRNGG